MALRPQQGEPHSSARRIPRPVLALAALALVVAVLEVLASGAGRLLERRPSLRLDPIADRLEEQSQLIREYFALGETALVELDDELGWVYAANVPGPPHDTSAQQLRSRRSYAAAPPPGMLRVAAFGDSFVYGSEVGTEETWAARLEALDPGLELLNYGVGGYGTDQALLHARRRAHEFAPHVVLLGFVEVDYARNLSRYRRFVSPRDLPLFKPRFTRTEDGELALLANPFPGRAGLERILEAPRDVFAAGEGDWFFEPLEWSNPLYDLSRLVRLGGTLLAHTWRSFLSPDRLYRGDRMNRDCEGFALLVALIERFAAEVTEDGRSFALVVFPSRTRDIWGEGGRTYEPLLQALEGLPVLDLADALAGDPALSPDTLFAPGGHYAPAAHDRVAAALGPWLRALPGTERAVRSEPRRRR